MSEFLEIDDIKKTVKSIDLDDFSIEDLDSYIIELKNEIKRVREEIEKKSKLLSDAQKFFK